MTEKLPEYVRLNVEGRKALVELAKDKGFGANFKQIASEALIEKRDRELAPSK